MSAIEVICLLYGYLTVSLAVSLVAVVRKRRTAILSALLVALLLIACVLLSYRIAGTSPLSTLLTSISDRQPRPLLAAILGGAASLTWIPWSLQRHTSHGIGSSRQLTAINWTSFAWLASFTFVVLACGGALAWDHAFDIQLTKPQMLIPGLSIRKVADLERPPVRLCTGKPGVFFVSTYFTDDSGRFGGSIEEFSKDPETRAYRGKLVCTSYMLYRPFGLVAVGDRLYVSRSGHATWANNGTVTDENSGAITALADLDRDGYYEYADDIVQNLPGAGGPDTMHQNNGIAVGANGELFVAIGTSGDREIDERPFAGSVTKINVSDGTQTLVAEGLRNPFGIAVSEEGDVFVTDNDSSDNGGDELNHIIQGEHYGHPFVVPGDVKKPYEGYRNALLLSENTTSFGGIAFAEGPHVPPELRGKLLLCDMGSNRLLAITLKKDGNSYTAHKVDVIATLHSPLDVAVGADGVIYVTSRFYECVYAIEADRIE